MLFVELQLFSGHHEHIRWVLIGMYLFKNQLLLFDGFPLLVISNNNMLHDPCTMHGAFTQINNTCYHRKLQALPSLYQVL